MDSTQQKYDIESGIVARTEYLVFRKSAIHGTGAFAAREIPRETRIIEYTGERISKSESLRRCEANNEYIFTLTETEDLDGSVDWNLARFINHSCEPNCDAEEIEGRIWIVANRDILPGQELSFNYGFDLEDFRDHPCQCGKAACVGYIVAEEFFEHVRRRADFSESPAQGQ
jgi:Proteins containing SET domain